MKLTLAFSPCPNDTFIFDAMVHQKIDTEGLTFEVILEDVETLNQWALEGKYDITKISYGSYPSLVNDYLILNSGSALGKAVGPLWVYFPGSKQIAMEEEMVALPGEHTTAHFLFSYAFPQVKNKVFLRYDAIEDFVLQGKGSGVIIHENRFTYAQKGLLKRYDLGEVWEKQTQLPIPLGGIVMNRKWPMSLIRQIDRLIRKSVEYALERYPLLTEYIKRNAQEMEEDIMRRHIDLYVNASSVDLGESGKEAIQKMMKVMGLSETSRLPFFIP